MKFHLRYVSIAITLLALLAACGGGSDNQAAINDPASAATPAGGSITLVTCTPAPVAVGVSRYSRVFKECNSNGIPQYYELDECVLDTTTGLIWQGQTPAGSGLRANDQYKSNYDSTVSLQKTIQPVVSVAPSISEINAATNSIGYKNLVNASELCGSYSWRLPTSTELETLIKLDESPTIDNAAFPNMPSSGSYWSSSTGQGDYAGLIVIFGSRRAYGGSNATRNGGYGGFGNPALVRLVR